MTRRADKKNRKQLNRRKQNSRRLALETLEARTVLDAAMSAAMASFMGDDLVGKDGPMARLGWDLTLLHHDYASVDPDAPDENDQGEPDNGDTPEPIERNSFMRDLMQIENNYVHVQLVAANPSLGSEMMTSLTEIGMQIVASDASIASGWVPIHALDDLAALSSVGGVQPSYKPYLSTGSVDSQGDAAMQTDEARILFDIDGSGVKIGAISDSYDTSKFVSDFAFDNVLSGDLPGFFNPNGYDTPVQVLADAIPLTQTDEGRGMLQIVHDVAPGAELAFHSVGNSTLEFGDAIRELALQGSDVIVDDVIFFAEPFFQDGLVAQAVEEVVAEGTVYLNSAGNGARHSFEQDWDNSGNFYPADSLPILPVPVAPFFGGNSMDFNPLGGAADDFQSFQLLPGATAILSFQWDDPFTTDSHGLNSPKTDLDIYFQNNGVIVASGHNKNNLFGDAVEVIGYTNLSNQTQTYNILITHFSGPEPGQVKYVSYGSDLDRLEYDTFSSTISGHHNTEGGLSIGAAEWINTPEFGVNPAVQEDFSSAGGTPTYFDADGFRIPTIIRESPDVVGPDGANTTFFGFDSASDADFHPNFFGTSASAPHVAALVGLMLSANPDLTPAEIGDILRETASDMDDTFTPGFDDGFDFGTGYGYVDGVAAIQAAIDGFVPPPTGGGGGGGGGTTDPEPDHGCGDDFNLPTNVGVQAAVGSNIFITGHSILDNGVANGQLGYDQVVLDLLRGDGTLVEIEKSDYSVAILGNDGVNWSFSDGSQVLAGYEATHFYDIDLLSASDWAGVLAHDAIIVMSHDSAVLGGLRDAQLTVLAGFESMIADAVNDFGLDIWVNASGTSTVMYDFLPSGMVESSTLAASTDFYNPTSEGALFGLTSDMANSSDALNEFQSGDYDSDFFLFETRGNSEVVALAAQSVGFVNGQMMDSDRINQGTLSNLQGVSFNDLNQNGIQEANEAGLEGFIFYIDEDGDGQIGLCEPSAVSDANGKFLLFTHQAGSFVIQPVLEQGYLPTDDLVRTVTVNASGSRAEVNAPLDFGYIRAVDTGNAGNPAASHPVIDGLKLGDSPLLDDGVIFTQGLTVGGTNVATITSSTPLSAGILQGWMDFNRDGDWDDAGEQIFTNLALTAGTNNYSFEIPSSAFNDSSLPDGVRATAATRFRLDFRRDLTPTSEAFAGEVEDYEVKLNSDADSGMRLADDSYYYAEDTAVQYFHVLDNDSHLLGKDITITSVTNVSPNNPLLVFSIASDGKSVLLDTTGLIALGEDITFTYNVVDSSGNTGSADVTLEVGLVGGLSTTSSSSGNGISAFTNSVNSTDVNGDGIVTFVDVAKIVAELQNGGSRALPKYVPNPGSVTNFIDTDGNNQITPVDLLTVLDYLLASRIPAESELIETTTVSASPVSTTSIDLVQPIATAFTVASEETTPAVSDPTQFVGWALNWRSNSPASSRIENESALSTASSDLSTDSFFEGLDSDLSQVIADASDADQWYLATDLEETVDELALELNEKWEDALEESA